MLIDPRGLLKGDRIGACSDEAQLHFPRILASSNSYGRFRMSVEWLQSEVYGSFSVKPTKDQLTAWLREYHANFLLFVYKAPDGALWAQWDIPEKLLGGYRLAADKKTPEPPARELKAFKYSYAESIRVRNEANHDLKWDGFGNVPKVSRSFQNVSETSETVENNSSDVLVGVGVGVIAGVGVGVVSSPAAPEPTSTKKRTTADPEAIDSRHVPFREAVHAQWRENVPGCDAAPWDGSEAKALTNLLRANPHITLDQFAQCLANRAQSRVQPSDRPRRWLETITDYLSGPKDEFGKPLHGSRPREPGVHRPQAVARALEGSALTRDEEEELAIVNAMRAERGNGPLTAAEMYPQKAAVQ